MLTHYYRRWVVEGSTDGRAAAMCDVIRNTLEIPLGSKLDAPEQALVCQFFGVGLIWRLPDGNWQLAVKGPRGETAFGSNEPVYALMQYTHAHAEPCPISGPFLECQQFTYHGYGSIASRPTWGYGFVSAEEAIKVASRYQGPSAPAETPHAHEPIFEQLDTHLRFSRQLDLSKTNVATLRQTLEATVFRPGTPIPPVGGSNKKRKEKEKRQASAEEAALASVMAGVVGEMPIVVEWTFHPEASLRLDGAMTADAGGQPFWEPQTQRAPIGSMVQDMRTQDGQRKPLDAVLLATSGSSEKAGQFTHGILQPLSEDPANSTESYTAPLSVVRVKPATAPEPASSATPSKPTFSKAELIAQLDAYLDMDAQGLPEDTDLADELHAKFKRIVEATKAEPVREAAGEPSTSTAGPPVPPIEPSPPTAGPPVPPTAVARTELPSSIAPPPPEAPLTSAQPAPPAGFVRRPADRLAPPVAPPAPPSGQEAPPSLPPSPPSESPPPSEPDDTTEEREAGTSRSQAPAPTPSHGATPTTLHQATTTASPTMNTPYPTQQVPPSTGGQPTDASFLAYEDYQVAAKESRNSIATLTDTMNRLMEEQARRDAERTRRDAEHMEEQARRDAELARRDAELAKERRQSTLDNEAMKNDLLKKMLALRAPPTGTGTTETEEPRTVPPTEGPSFGFGPSGRGRGLAITRTASSSTGAGFGGGYSLPSGRSRTGPRTSNAERFANPDFGRDPPQEEAEDALPRAEED